MHAAVSMPRCRPALTGAHRTKQHNLSLFLGHNARPSVRRSVAWSLEPGIQIKTAQGVRPAPPPAPAARLVALTGNTHTPPSRWS